MHQVSFSRPRAETDRLFMNIGGDDVIEMQHPAVPADVPEHQRPGKPMLRLGAIASGKPLVREDQLRLEFAARHQCIGTDTEFDQVTTVCYYYTHYYYYCANLFLFNQLIFWCSFNLSQCLSIKFLKLLWRNLISAFCWHDG